MAVAFSEFPGRHERHYRRRIDNPLFGTSMVRRDDNTLLEMQRLDHEELLAFISALRTTLQAAIELPQNASSEVILGLKQDLDRLYEQSAGLAESHAANQAAIAELVEVVMGNVERSAGADPQAAAELAQERLARVAHYELLKYPLVADLLHPQSVIVAEHLAPALLSAHQDELAVALGLFDAGQLRELYASALGCCASLAVPTEAALQRLRQIRDGVEALSGCRI